MTKNLFLGFAAIALAAGAASKSFAESLTDDTTAPPVDGEEPSKRRGRPPGGGKAETPATPAAASTAPSDEERLEKNKALVRPYIDAQRGEEVKKIISKYSQTALKGIPADKQADFEKDLATLDY